jgi:calreticulin
MNLLVALLGVALCEATIHFDERFDDSWADRWVHTSHTGKEYGTFSYSAGTFYGDAQLDKGIKTSTDARFYAISSKIAKPFSNEGKDLVLQFSVKHEQKIDCGGGYIKLLPASADLKNFNGDSQYYVMFGPDICGPGTKKVHTIFNYKGDNNLIKKDVTCETDQLNHLYTLIVHPDQTYEIKIDDKSKQTGKFEDDWDFLKPKLIKDPAVSKPSDWVDDKMMDDPNDHKPAGYDDIPAMIRDPDATKPEDWDDDLDGEWEAPEIDNPEYKGKWAPKKIENPAYKGPWVHPEIANPDYEHDSNIYRFKDIGAVGIDIWQVKAGTIFDNILVTDSISEAEAHAKKYFLDLKDSEKKMFDDIEQKRKDAEEAERKKAEEERKADEAAEDDGDDEKADKAHEDL